MKKASSCIDFSFFFLKGSVQSLVLIASPLAKHTNPHTRTHTHAAVSTPSETVTSQHQQNIPGEIRVKRHQTLGSR